MKLFQDTEFEQAILQAADHFRSRGLRPAIIEKDYYVTEALRIIAGAGGKVIFKGGTSLAKGWNLIQRFSEDIDIFLDPAAVDGELTSWPRLVVGFCAVLDFIPKDKRINADIALSLGVDFGGRKEKTVVPAFPRTS